MYLGLGLNRDVDAFGMIPVHARMSASNVGFSLICLHDTVVNSLGRPVGRVFSGT